MQPSQKPKFTKHRYAGVYLVTNNRKIIGQHRDNKPNIDHPDKISAFGGTIEPGETPAQAAWRELVQEETNLILDIPQLVPFTEYVAWRKLTSEWETLYFFYVMITDEMLNMLEIYEGQGWEYIDSPNSESIVEPTRQALTTLFDILSKK